MLSVVQHACYSGTSVLDQQLKQILGSYINTHRDDELISGVSASVGLPHQDIKSYSTGTISRDKNSDLMLTDNLFQIGSITKSFTSVIILLLEHEGRLNINQKLGLWLPQYPNWKDVTIKQLLNMTSGIPSYVTIPKLASKITQNIKKQWSNRELVDIAYSYPQKAKGYDYSDTNYLILGMIIEKAARDTFTGQINSRLITKYNLSHTLYYVEPYQESLIDVMPSGYYYGKSTGSIRHGEDVIDTNMSMAGAAGALLSNSEDIIRWVRLLFSGKVLPPNQQHELTEIVSMKTGKPIKTTDHNDVNGFGLGVVQGYNSDIGKYWYYEGTTVGHRAVYLWNPCNDIIVSVALNSSRFVDETVKDHSGELLFALYKAVVNSNKQYACINA